MVQRESKIMIKISKESIKKLNSHLINQQINSYLLKIHLSPSDKLTSYMREDRRKRKKIFREVLPFKVSFLQIDFLLYRLRVDLPLHLVVLQEDVECRCLDHLELSVLAQFLPLIQSLCLLSRILKFNNLRKFSLNR